MPVYYACVNVRTYISALKSADDGVCMHSHLDMYLIFAT